MQLRRASSGVRRRSGVDQYTNQGLQLSQLLLFTNKQPIYAQMNYQVPAIPVLLALGGQLLGKKDATRPQNSPRRALTI